MMNNRKSKEMYYLCRICLKTDKNMISLFTKTDKCSPFEKLVSNTGIKIHDNDQEPRFICNQCLDELNIVVNFLDKCIKSNFLCSQINCAKNINADRSLGDYDESITIYSADEMTDSEGLNSDKLENITNQCHILEQERCLKKLPKTYCCQYCNKIFTRKFNFTVHLRRHRGEIVRSRKVDLRRTCATCNKSFTSVTNLATHIRTHTGERPFVCTVCGKTFRSKNTLNDHTKIHTGEKRYMCQQCGKRFTTNKLAAHSRSHAVRLPTGSVPVNGMPAGPVPANRVTASPVPTNRVPAALAQGAARMHACRYCPATYRHRQSLNKHVRQRHKG